MQVKPGVGLEMLSFTAFWDRCLPHFLSEKLCGDNAEIAQKCLSFLSFLCNFSSAGYFAKYSLKDSKQLILNRLNARVSLSHAKTHCCLLLRLEVN